MKPFGVTRRMGLRGVAWQASPFRHKRGLPDVVFPGLIRVGLRTVQPEGFIVVPVRIRPLGIIPDIVVRS
jgi:hypothetical protein